MVNLGFLCVEGSGGAADLIPELMEKLEPQHPELVVFDEDPERLVATLVAMLDKEYSDINIKDDLARWYLDDNNKAKHID